MAAGEIGSDDTVTSRSFTSRSLRSFSSPAAPPCYSMSAATHMPPQSRINHGMQGDDFGVSASFPHRRRGMSSTPVPMSQSASRSSLAHDLDGGLGFGCVGTPQVASSLRSLQQLHDEDGNEQGTVMLCHFCNARLGSTNSLCTECNFQHAGDEKYVRFSHGKYMADALERSVSRETDELAPAAAAKAARSASADDDAAAVPSTDGNGRAGRTVGGGGGGGGAGEEEEEEEEEENDYAQPSPSPARYLFAGSNHASSIDERIGGKAGAHSTRERQETPSSLASCRGADGREDAAVPKMAPVSRLSAALAASGEGESDRGASDDGSQNDELNKSGDLQFDME